MNGGSGTELSVPTRLVLVWTPMYAVSEERILPRRKDPVHLPYHTHLAAGLTDRRGLFLCAWVYARYAQPALYAVRREFQV